MLEDEQGFLFPQINTTSCINCNLCSKVCPALRGASFAPRGKAVRNVYAAKNNDTSTRLKSSSGGLFSAISEYIIKQGGIVFGAKFTEDWKIVHSYTDTLDGIPQFMGSKYYQSEIGNTYVEAENFLKSGRIVLFTGTPCQIAGLKRFLRKDYDNLLAVDIVCHGVPSYKIFKSYLDEYHKNEKITGVSFRNKSYRGWENYGLEIKSERGSSWESKYENLFMLGFRNALFYRTTCYKCSWRGVNGMADLTIADFWGIRKTDSSFYDEKGISLVQVRTDRGSTVINKLDISKIKTTYGQAYAYNAAMEKDMPKHIQSNKFWEGYKIKGIKILEEINFSTKESIIKVYIQKIKRNIIYRFIK